MTDLSCCVLSINAEDESTKTATIVLRGGTTNAIDDLERAIDDGINTIKAAVKDGRLVPGAGATEIELARQLTLIGERTSGLNQYAIKKFAEAFEVIPKTLSDNAGLDVRHFKLSTFCSLLRFFQDSILHTKPEDLLLRG